MNFLQVDTKINYQASSPDEIALVSWTESVGLTLVERDTTTITLRTPHGSLMSFTVLQVRQIFLLFMLLHWLLG